MDESISQAEVPTPAEVRQAVEAAVHLQRNGRLEQAEAIYAALLSMLPDEPDALHFLGVLRHQQGRLDEALHFIARSIREQPAAGGTWLNLSNVLIEAGRHDEATQALSRVVELKPDSAGVYNNLAILHRRMGRPLAAEQCLLKALEVDPSSHFVHANLSSLYYAIGRFEESIDHGLKAIGSGRKGHSSARFMVSLSLVATGQIERAIDNLRQWLEDDPDNPHPSHHLAALGVGEVPWRASDHYVRDEFDHFAKSFDAKLESLGYRAPGLIGEALSVLGPRLPTGGDVLDAGCGTGLCASHLRPLAARLIGVDLSAGMLEKAHVRASYDELHHGELTEFIAASAGRFAIIASADTLIYFGDLAPVMAAADRALQPGGVLVATVEALPDDTVDHVLQFNGRYAHSGAYMRRVVEQHGLEVVVLRREVLRREAGQSVTGWLLVAIRPAQADPRGLGDSR